MYLVFVQCLNVVNTYCIALSGSVLCIIYELIITFILQKILPKVPKIKTEKELDDDDDVEDDDDDDDEEEDEDDEDEDEDDEDDDEEEGKNYYIQQSANNPDVKTPDRR